MSLEARLITLKGDSIFENAVNASVIESVAQGNHPALIFYNMKPSISIGRSQHSGLDVNDDACKKESICVARRDSGGQAVYIDDSYVVFSLVAPPNVFGTDLTKLRNKFSTCMAETLQNIGVPATFYEPDNVVTHNGTYYMTMGNSGQIITRDSILVEGSLRHSHAGFDSMINSLRINGHPLHPYKEDIRKVLAAITDYNKIIPKDEIKNRLVDKISKAYGFNFYTTDLSASEIARARELANPTTAQQKLVNAEAFKSRGICYLFLNGQNLVGSLHKILPYNTPSNVTDSTLIVREVKHAS